jgi:hypothetical protein
VEARARRCRRAPAVLAAIRNAVTTALRLTGAVNIAAARRAAALDPTTGSPSLHPATRSGQRFAMTEPCALGGQEQRVCRPEAALFDA